jgi:hypothetical protein
MPSHSLLRSTGVLRYSPELARGAGHTRRDGGSTWWWLIVDCDPELGRYLRHQFLLGHRRTRALQSPLWGPHISVIRGEVPPNVAAWKRLDGATVEFDYDPMVCETEGFVWCPVSCVQALSIREELGLAREPSPALHLTIGNANQAAGGEAI